MNGDGYDGFYQKTLLNSLRLKRMYKGDAFQRIAALLNDPHVNVDTLIDLRRIRYDRTYDTDLNGLVEHALSTWCDFALHTDYALFKYSNSKIHVFKDYAEFVTPRVSVRLYEKEFTLWRERFLDYPKETK